MRSQKLEKYLASTLQNSKLILCENTLNSKKLLNKYEIKTSLDKYTDHDFEKKKDKILNLIKTNNVVSLISDSGSPLISDPGSQLIHYLLKNKVKIISIPGPSAMILGIQLSGFLNKKNFTFLGFLPKKQNDLTKVLESLSNLNFSLIFFIPAIKINFYINNFRKYFLDRDLLIAREMTKLHETFYRNKIDKIKNFSIKLKGELTVIISKKKKNKNQIKKEPNVTAQAKKLLKKYSLKDVVELISRKEKISKKKIYKICLELKYEKNI